MTASNHSYQYNGQTHVWSVKHTILLGLVLRKIHRDLLCHHDTLTGCILSFLQVPVSTAGDACRFHEGIKQGWKYLFPICTPACYSTHAAVQHTVTLLAELLHCHLRLPQGISRHGALPTEFDPNFLTPRLLGVRPLQSSIPTRCCPKGILWHIFTQSSAPQLVHADKSWGNCWLCLEAGSILCKK